jgi:hypothetical protein
VPILAARTDGYRETSPFCRRLSGSQIERAIPGTARMSLSRDIRATRNGESRVPAVDGGLRKPPLTCANASSALLTEGPRII